MVFFSPFKKKKTVARPFFGLLKKMGEKIPPPKKKNGGQGGVFGGSLHLYPFVQKPISRFLDQNLFGDVRFGAFFRNLGNIIFFYGSFM